MDRPAKMDHSPGPGDSSTSVRASVMVDVPIEHAFQVFTSDFGRWWPKPHSLGSTSLATAHIEPRVGGRWYELDHDGVTRVWGMVLAWDPPRRLTLSWQMNRDQRHGEVPHPSSQVAVRFTALGECSTKVDLRHTDLNVHCEGWRRLRDRSPSSTRAA
jgi:uncharacterized protein YndB with AHSA1/START domain